MKLPCVLDRKHISTAPLLNETLRPLCRCEKERTQFTLAKHSTKILEREEWDQRNGEDNHHIKNARGLPSPTYGKLSANVFPLNFPTTTSSTISKISNRIV